MKTVRRQWWEQDRRPQSPCVNYADAFCADAASPAGTEVTLNTRETTKNFSRRMFRAVGSQNFANFSPGFVPRSFWTRVFGHAVVRQGLITRMKIYRTFVRHAYIMCECAQRLSTGHPRKGVVIELLPNSQAIFFFLFEPYNYYYYYYYQCFKVAKQFVFVCRKVKILWNRF